MRWIVRFLATGFFVGYSPMIPGTLGTLVGLLLYTILPTSIPFYWFLLIFLTIGGIAISQQAERILGEIDSRKIVIDEICGYFVSLAFLPKRITLMLLGFLIYRFLDVVKVYPIKRIEMLKGGVGIMLDDIYAGVITNLMLHLVHRI